jgi:hypothetical protein
MSDVRIVTPEQYADVCAKLERARLLTENARTLPMTLAQKLVLLREAKELREQAAKIGHAGPLQ